MKGSSVGRVLHALSVMSLIAISHCGEIWRLRSWLDKQLVEYVQSDAPQDNFNWVRKMLKENRVGELDRAKFQVYQLKGELEKFLALEPMSSDEKCDEESFTTLTDNDLANGNWTNRRENNQEKMKRVDKIYREVMVAHAKSCRQIHLQRFASRESQIDKTVRRDVSILFDNLLEKDTRAPYTTLANPYFVQAYLVPGLEKIAALEKIPNPIGSLKTKIIVTTQNKNKVRAMADLLLRQRCLTYVKQWGLYFRMANWDNKFVETVPHIIDTATREFIFARGRYKLCELVPKDWPILEDLIISRARNGK